MNASCTQKGTIRVAFLDDHLSFGGATVNLVRLLPKLREHGLDVRVMASDLHDEMGPEFVRTETRVQYYRARGLWNLYDDRLLQAYRLLADFKPHVVVASHEPMSFDLLRYVPRGVFRIAVARSDDWHTYRWLLHHALWIDVAVGLTKSICRSISDLPVSAPLTVAYIPNGISVPESLPPRAPSVSGALRILYIGRLVREAKQVQRFVPIWQEILQRDLPIEWTFLGDGQEREYLEQSLVSTTRQRVSFAGEAPHDKVPEYCARHDVIALVSSYEGFTIGVLEGMSYGLIPVVTRQRGGTPDMLTPACGFCVAPDDPAAFVDALECLAYDTGTREAMRKAAYERICENFTQNRNVILWCKQIEQGAKNEVDWPQHTPFLGLYPNDVVGEPLKRFYYHPVVRPVRRLAHWVCTVFSICGKAIGRWYDALKQKAGSR